MRYISLYVVRFVHRKEGKRTNKQTQTANLFNSILLLKRIKNKIDLKQSVFIG